MFEALAAIALEASSPDQMAATRRFRMVRPFLEAQSAHSRFNSVSLEAWLRLAADAGVPAVPGEVIARIPVEALLRFEDPAAWTEHQSILEAANKAVGDGEMLRWDCCASLDLKFAMDKTPDQVSMVDRASLHPGDPRFFDILYEFPEDEMRVLRRPWVSARREGSHPVEYRVFVKAPGWW